MTSDTRAAQTRLERLTGFLEQDPDNANLLADAARLACDIGAVDQADALMARYERIAPLPYALINLRALAAMKAGRFDQAVDDLSSLTELEQDGEEAAALRFNLAWALAMTGEYAAADMQLDDPALAASPRAPALKIHMMHHQGLYDEAMALGGALAVRFPANGELFGALAMLALDMGDSVAAEDYARRAGPGSGEGVTSLAMLGLQQQRPADALRLFDEALLLSPESPRAWLGRGLALLAAGDSGTAAADLDKGAALFGTHLGAWIAAGWAHFAAGDRAAAKARFETALTLDGSFSEVHGSLAVLDVVEGDLGSARQRSQLALRLDRESFSGALAASLLLDGAGEAGAAEAVRAKALSAMIGDDGQTLAQLLAGFDPGKSSR